MSKEYVKQHIVPKCYLDRFAEQKQERFVIGTRVVLKNGKVKIFEQATTEVGYIKNYYDVTDKEDPKYWEHFLANKVDNLCDKKLAQIISSVTLAGDGFSLSNEDKSILSTIIVAQMLRVPDSINYVMNEIIPRVTDEVKREFYSSFPSYITNRYKSKINGFHMSEQNQKEHYLNFIFDPDNFNRFVEILKHRTWVIYFNSISKDLPFITSDNPVLIEDISNQNNIGIFKNGVANPCTCIYFPLSPSIAVANYSDKGIFALVTNKLDGKVFKINETKFIINKNILLMEQAYAHSFIPKPYFYYVNQ